MSDPGRITEAATEFIAHTLTTTYGSSGAPLFDKEWQFVALHRGKPETRRNQKPGTSEGIPLSTLWEILIRTIPTLQ